MNLIVNKKLSTSSISLGTSLLIALATFISVIIAPGLLSLYLEGPDGTLWVRPLLIWMGFIFTLYGLLPFFFEEIDYTKESYFAGACLLLWPAWLY